MCIVARAIGTCRRTAADSWVLISPTPVPAHIGRGRNQTQHAQRDPAILAAVAPLDPM